MRIWSLPLLTVAALLLLTVSADRAVAQQDAAEAQQQVRAFLNTVTDGLDRADDAVGALRQAQQALELAEGAMDEDTRQRVLRLVRETQGSVAAYAERLAIVGQAAQGVQTLMDLQELREIVNRRRDELCPLAGNLTLLAEAMEQFGGQVPLIGPAIESLGTITKGTLVAIEQVGETIDENRNQGAIGGPGYYPVGPARRLYEKLREQFPAEADNYRWRPGVPGYVYRNVTDARRARTLIWDAEADRWHLVERGPHQVERAFRMSLLAGRRWDPQMLVHACGDQAWQLALERVAAADALRDYFQALTFDTRMWEALSSLRGRHDGRVLDALHQLCLDYMSDVAFEQLQARLAYDYNYRFSLSSSLGDLYRELVGRELDPRRLRALLIEYFGVDPAEEEGDEEDEDQPAQDNGADLADADAPAADPDPALPREDEPGVVVERSVLFLVDCSGSMSGRKIEQARASVIRAIDDSNDGTTEWALLRFSGCSVQVAHPFTTRPEGIKQAAQTRLTAGGQTPLTLALGKAMTYMYQNARGQRGLLVVLCDGEDNCCTTNPREARETLQRLTRTVDLSAAAPE